MDLEQAKKKIAELNSRVVALTNERDAAVRDLGQSRAHAALVRELVASGVPAGAADSVATLELMSDAYSFERDGTVLRGKELPTIGAIAKAATKSHAEIVENAKRIEGGGSRSGGRKGGASRPAAGERAGQWLGDSPEELREMEMEGLLHAHQESRKAAGVLDVAADLER